MASLDLDMNGKGVAERERERQQHGLCTWAKAHLGREGGDGVTRGRGSLRVL